jgi:hypothetical protein
MEQALLSARRLDDEFDYCGPDRTVGLLYLEAPGWPLGVGNRGKARAHLLAAVKGCPAFPENRLCLAEAYAKWGEAQNLERELKALDELMPQARTRFAPEIWDANWRDWDARLEKLKKAQERSSAHPRVSPGERGARSRD